MSATLAILDRVVHEVYLPRLLDSAQFAMWFRLWMFGDWETIAQIEARFTPELCARAGGRRKSRGGSGRPA